ncbi:hypothetical protein SNOG_06759 [Parastagonospora nodorum SN15]|uniref:Uncharacterized protein n=1 Tax=Phaeosphaeria nodorum (strain SN15 / ATCC MYA-4574 / FGSC 10173) TaxID=321614 RepID=Q0UNA5_PHANO|nr:hypothetical protein SNOG_06759 [Parastagonospora nodorum SN15]EAT85410.1 hypothetical protein SNOG_06759 [Parastagonospora nodorum SN15]
MATMQPVTGSPLLPLPSCLARATASSGSNRQARRSRAPIADTQTREGTESHRNGRSGSGYSGLARSSSLAQVLVAHVRARQEGSSQKLAQPARCLLRHTRPNFTITKRPDVTSTISTQDPFSLDPSGIN